jgi:hypothetical protein
MLLPLEATQKLSASFLKRVLMSMQQGEHTEAHCKLLLEAMRGSDCGIYNS